jgi:hypothetical protein
MQGFRRISSVQAVIDHGHSRQCEINLSGRTDK